MKFLVKMVYLFICLSSMLHASELITKKIENAALKKYGSFAKNRFVSVQNDLIKKLKNASIAIQEQTCVYQRLEKDVIARRKSAGVATLKFN